MDSWENAKALQVFTASSTMPYLEKIKDMAHEEMSRTGRTPALMLILEMADIALRRCSGETLTVH